MEQIKLNKELYDAICSPKIDFTHVENLLKLGADPLGSMSEDDPEEHILEELFCEASNNSVVADRMPEIIQLFYCYGMIIASREYSHQRDSINPLWSLQFCSDENGLKMLKVMLDHDLDCNSAEELIEHIFIDMEMCNGCNIDNDYLYNSTISSLKMVMLIASYSQYIDSSEYLRECIDLDNNNRCDLAAFREWNDFEYRIDLTTCTNVPYGLRGATIKIYNKATQKHVWTFFV